MREQSQKYSARRVACVVGAIITMVTPSASAQSTARDVRGQRQGDGVIRVEIPVEQITADILRDVNRMVGRVTNEDVSRDIRDAMREVTAALSAIGNIDLGDLGRDLGRELGRNARLRSRTGNAADGDADQDRDFRAEQTDRTTKTLTLGATGSLELRNLIGDITVTAGSGRDTTVEIIRRSRGRTDADAKTGLERVTVNVDQRADRATVNTNYPVNDRRPPYTVSVSYIVTAPAGTRVTASSTSGDLSFKNIKGEISADVTSGDIVIAGAGKVAEARTISGDISLTDVASDERLSVGTVSGTVTLLRVKARQVDVDVTSGDVVAREMAAGAIDMKCLSGSVEYAGTLVRGGRYTLQAHSGDLRFFASGGVGFDLQASTFSGALRQEPGLDLKGATTSRRALRGTVGDGGATVIATTFSGNVTVGKK